MCGLGTIDGRRSTTHDRPQQAAEKRGQTRSAVTMQMQAKYLYYVCSALIIDNLGLVQAHAYAARTYEVGTWTTTYIYTEYIYIYG